MDNDDPKSYSIKEQLILMLPNSTGVNRKEIFYWWDNISLNHIKYPSVKWDLFLYSSNVFQLLSNVLLICFFVFLHSRIHIQIYLIQSKIIVLNVWAHKFLLLEVIQQVINWYSIVSNRLLYYSDKKSKNSNLYNPKDERNDLYPIFFSNSMLFLIVFI